MAPYNFSTPQHKLNPIMNNTAKGIWKSHTNFGSLFSMHDGLWLF